MTLILATTSQIMMQRMMTTLMKNNDSFLCYSAYSIHSTFYALIDYDGGNVIMC